MKHIHKLFLTAAVLLLGLIIASCSNNEQSRTEEANCNCWTILQTTSFTLPNQSPYSVMTLENDCSGLQKQINRNGVYVVGSKICDN